MSNHTKLITHIQEEFSILGAYDDPIEGEILRELHEVNIYARVRALIEALRDLSGLRDIVFVDEGLHECQWCGRSFWEGDNAPRLCPSDDCPGHQARALLAELTADNR